MGFDSLLRSAVQTASRLTASLQVDVQHEARTGIDGYGKPTFAAAVTRAAIVELRPKLLRRPDGQEVMASATVTFLGNVAIAVEDRLTLPGGQVGTVLTVGGVADPASGTYMVTATLGNAGGAS
jgi:hypothetical protein